MATQVFDTHAALYMHKEGFNDTQISDALRSSRETVKAWRKKAKLEANAAPGRPYSFDIEKAEVLIQAGVETSKIAGLLETTTQSISSFRKKLTSKKTAKA